MDINQAKKIVVSCGATYFYDEIERFSIDEIILQIKEHILFGTARVEGLLEREIVRDAFFKVVEELDVVDPLNWTFLKGLKGSADNPV